MSRFRVGGLICLFLLIMAVVLSIGGLAQNGAPVGDAPPSDAPPSDTSARDATSSDSVGSESSAVGSVPSDTDADDTSTSDVTPPDVVEETPADDATSDDIRETFEVDVPPPSDVLALLGDAPRSDVASEVTEDSEIAEEDDVDYEDEEDEDRELKSTGDRIWREGYSELEYTWTPQSFSGFFYDIDDDVGTENLTVRLEEGERSIDEKKLEYVTEAQEISFEFNDWGSYQVIGFLAEKYFAGYHEGTNKDVIDDEINLIDEGELRKVLIDSDEEYTVTTGSVLPLENGYELRIKAIDLDGNKVWLSLAEDGDEVDSKVVVPGDVGDSTYTYEIDISGEDMPLVMAHVSNVFSGAETSLVTLDALFQISDEYTSVEDGDSYDKMEVDSVSGNKIVMKNDDSISLRKGKDVTFMGDVLFQVGDSNELRFAPYVKKTGNYEIRGTVVDPDKVDEFTWTPYNFEAFYYDIDDDVGTEELFAEFTGDKIDDGDLVYKTRPDTIEFEYDDWGKYQVVGFLAEKYFAGYTDDTTFTDEFSVLNEEQLRKVLMDDDESYTVRSGTTFPLEEGYELRIKEVDLDGNKVWLAITKDGDEVDNKVVDPGSSLKSSTFIYEDEIGSDDVPIIAIHIQSIFRGKEEDLATIEGVFQVSDDPAVIEEGEFYGKMKIESVSDRGIILESDSSISLGRGKTVSFMENMKFKVADSSKKKLVAPIVEIKGEIKPLNLYISDAVVGSQVNIEATSRGDPVSGVRITVDGNEIGSTDGGGIAIYVPNVAGTFDLEALKSGYSDFKTTFEIKEVKEERVLAISAPPEVLKGEDFVIKVSIGLDQRPVASADIFFDGIEIGSTDPRGIFSYSSDSVGGHTIKASKSDFEDGSRNILVLSSIESIGLQMGETVSAGKKVKITVDLENTGTVSDIKSLDLKVNGNSVETKEVTVEPGEISSVTFEYTAPEEPGMYTVEVEGIQKTLTVEEKSNTTLLVVAALILLLLIGGGAYLYTSGKGASQLESIKGGFKK